MGRQATILRVFVASPSDLWDERTAVDIVARELNQTQSDRTGAFLDVIKWETHALPGVGKDPQSLVTDSIGDNYDIFIGILSTRFGTPTPRAFSGTEEEFERAYARYEENPSQIRIMFYFKDPQIKPSELDLDQYALVRAFQKKLDNTGLYFTFSSTDEFTTLVRLHLTRQLQDWADGNWGGKSQQRELSSLEEIADAITPVASNEEDEESGLLDYIEIMRENLETATQTLDRILNAIGQLSRKTEENTPKLIEANSKGDLARSKIIVNNVARELTEFSERMNSDIPIFSRSYSTAMDAVSKSATLWESDFNEDQTGIENTFVQIGDLIEGIGTAKESMSLMQEAVIKLPRLTVLLNKGKKQASDALIIFDRELNSALNLTREAQTELSRILQSKQINVTSKLSNEDAVMEIADYLRCSVHPNEPTLVRFEQLTSLGLTVCQVSECFLDAAEKADCDVIDKSDTRATVKRRPPPQVRLIRA